MKNFCFTVDDNIRFFREITERGYDSIFDHPYLAMYLRLHKEFGLKVQLNLFYETEGFDLSMMTDRYRDEWRENSDWLKMSFHSRMENERPYDHSGYDEVYNDCRAVHGEILRFASAESLAKTTTIHYCATTEEGNRALADNGYKGLLGLFGTPENKRVSYSVDGEVTDKIRDGKTEKVSGISYATIDIVLNKYDVDSILSQLSGLTERELVKVMIHEQYFYPDYRRYQENFEEKLRATFSFLTENGNKSAFFEEVI